VGETRLDQVSSNHKRMPYRIHNSMTKYSSGKQVVLLSTWT